MMKPVISICIPTYNRAECLRTCLESITEQFKDPLARESAEVVISDNASIDDTENLVKEFQKEFSNVLYYKNFENLGVDRNILNVVEKANGEYAWLMGDDDALFPDAIDYMLQKLKERKFKYCLVNCWGYDNKLLNPALRQPNFKIASDQYFGNLREYILEMAKKNVDKKNLVGNLCGLSTQIFNRQLWLAYPNKQEHIGKNIIHAKILLLVMKKQSFAMIANPLVKTRSANIRWETFSGSETLKKRVQSTYKFLIWIFETYEAPYSKLALKIEEYKSFLVGWIINTSKRYLFKSQASRDLIKKLLGKL